MDTTSTSHATTTGDHQVSENHTLMLPNQPSYRSSPSTSGGGAGGGGGGTGRASSGSNAWQAQESSVRPSTSQTRAVGTTPSKTAPKVRISPSAWLSRTSWYHSRVAHNLRSFLAGKFFAVVMIVALILALFLPDLWVVAGVNENVAIDSALTVVMFLFTMELVLLSLVDATYFCSFFQIMDIIGTISMMFDISYMLGTDATYAPVATGNSEAQKNLMLLRASRAAKIGARAGRLSRVLRILRFLPFLTAGTDDTQTGIASLISGRLSNLLATRVACLTIILVMVIPLFDIWTFPQYDYSLETWVDRISALQEEGRLDDALVAMGRMESFFSRYSYYPWAACVGTPSMTADGDDDFDCDSSQTWVQAWSPSRSGPSRGASSTRVTTDTFMVAFNMHATVQLKSYLAMAMIGFILFIMIFSSLALSSVVTELAVRPLERMLSTVRQIASTVFKFSAEVADENQDDADLDINSSNEMKLLEKVVQKLAIIADLQGTNHVKATADMQDEDLGILSMMQGKNVVDEQRAVATARKSVAMGGARKKALVPTVRLEDFGVPQNVYESWGFNALPLSKTQRVTLVVFTISRFNAAGEGFTSTQEEQQKLQRFIQSVEKEYLPVPFHNFAHAVDVAHATARIMNSMNSESFLTDLEQYALLIAAVSHDIGHPGVNNGFLAEVGHELAVQYNDRSPLENMHCAKLYTLVANPALNVFSKLSKEQYKEARKACIEVILHTDMMGHGAMVKDLQMLYQMNQEIFASKGDQPTVNGCNMAEVEIFTQADTKLLVMESVLHAADVSNPCRTWEVTHAWALVCLEEFFAQGDQEKLLGVPVQFLNDREKLNKPNSQIGFIEFMIAPFFTAQIRLWPGVQDMGLNLCENLAQWKDLWEQEVNPSEDEKGKVRTRVQKVKENVQEAITRDGSIAPVRT